jgi:hypothetical protein
VDVTPAESELPKSYQRILDHLYSRAIVIDNGSATAALMSVDAGVIPDQGSGASGLRQVSQVATLPALPDQWVKFRPQSDTPQSRAIMKAIGQLPRSTISHASWVGDSSRIAAQAWPQVL